MIARYHFVELADELAAFGPKVTVVRLLPAAGSISNRVELQTKGNFFYPFLHFYPASNDVYVMM